MKVNPFMTVITLLFSALAAFALYSYCRAEEQQWLITIAGGTGIFLTWAGTLAVSLADKRRNINFKVLSGLFAVINTVLQLAFTLKPVSTTTYVLVTGIIIFVWVIGGYSIGRSAND